MEGFPHILESEVMFAGQIPWYQNVDWVLARKQIANEPTWGTWGPETTSFDNLYRYPETDWKLPPMSTMD